METTTRPLLELWLIVEENFDALFTHGLCGVIYKIRLSGQFNMREENILCMIVDRYITNDLGLMALYGWPLGEKEPRIQFIQEQILKELRKP